MYQSKAAIRSLGVVGPAVAFLVQLLNTVGVDVSAEVVGVTQAVGHLIDSSIVLSGAAAGIYGRVRAKSKISGWFKSKA